MTSSILKKAMEKRDEALRQVERWEAWVKAYEELSNPPEDLLKVPNGQASSSAGEVDLASSLRAERVAKWSRLSAAAEDDKH
jgi:hypothetical protein